MPIKVHSDLPVKEALERENIFAMDENRALHQDIRPLQLVILNLMPLKEDTELQLLRALSNTPLQVDITLMFMETHLSKNTAISHLNQFYVRFQDICKQTFDGLIITGAPVEQMEFEDVDYWPELLEVMEWSKTHVTSTLHICWAAQAALYHHFGIGKRSLGQKLSGLYPTGVIRRGEALVRGFDDIFLAPQSRYTEPDNRAIRNCEQLRILAESEEAGIYLVMSADGKQIFITGHPEYDRMTLAQEYHRDVERGLEPDIPKNYFPQDDVECEPPLVWRAHANTLYTNWINYYVYQVTPYEISQVDMEL
ncbi:MAG: homoserine O-succinyltransferase [Lachnospiraceae bacterium]|nr:homoserine O-succinyltransferase [Lachnospiraceae bacterium]MDY5742266.1 homoserine O-succinyltransferase [Lachnospiraceae bacterium]